MSTNGQITFTAFGTAKRSYCHWDSYPSGLGVQVLGWLRGVVAGGREEETVAAMARLAVVGDFGCPPPTAGQRRALAQYADDRVGGPEEHWYRLLRQTQGEPAAILAAGYTYDQLSGIADAQDEYYTYTVDADQRTFSVLGRTWKWDDLPSDDEFTAALAE